MRGRVLCTGRWPWAQRLAHVSATMVRVLVPHAVRTPPPPRRDLAGGAAAAQKSCWAPRTMRARAPSTTQSVARRRPACAFANEFPKRGESPSRKMMPCCRVNERRRKKCAGTPQGGHLHLCFSFFFFLFSGHAQEKKRYESTVKCSVLNLRTDFLRCARTKLVLSAFPLKEKVRRDYAHLLREFVMPCRIQKFMHTIVLTHSVNSDCGILFRISPRRGNSLSIMMWSNAAKEIEHAPKLSRGSLVLPPSKSEQQWLYIF